MNTDVRHNLAISLSTIFYNNLIIEPFAATEFPNLFERRQVVVRTLAAERTFWEKATLLHAEHYRPAEKPFGESLTRHYYDAAQLYQGEIGRRAVAQTDLLESVVRHKSLFFHSGWVNYKTAVPGSIRLLPTRSRVDELKRDYEAMTEMIFAEPPPLDEILRVIWSRDESRRLGSSHIDATLTQCLSNDRIHAFIQMESNPPTLARLD